MPSDASKWRLNLFAILHGQSGYVGRYYRHFPRPFEQGVGIFAFDYRGHGRSSGGQRGLLPASRCSPRTLPTCSPPLRRGCAIARPL